jgi:hypothetical protein
MIRSILEVIKQAYLIKVLLSIRMNEVQERFNCDIIKKVSLQPKFQNKTMYSYVYFSKYSVIE